jgi:hypothetical protein
VEDLYQRMGEGHGSVIRNILTRDSVAYEESATDIQVPMVFPFFSGEPKG